MRKTLLILALISSTASAQALGGFLRGWRDAAHEDDLRRAPAQDSRRWERASMTSQEPTGDALLQRCSYQTMNGFAFSIVARNVCPYTVMVSPETGEVRK